MHGDSQASVKGEDYHHVLQYQAMHSNPKLYAPSSQAVVMEMLQKQQKNTNSSQPHHPTSKRGKQAPMREMKAQAPS